MGLKSILILLADKIFDSLQFGKIAELRVETLNRRYLAIQEIADYLTGAEIEGDYIEFGVYRGNTFSYAYKRLSNLFPEMKFIACDSFEGLPEMRGKDIEGHYSSGFSKNEFACIKESFMENLKRRGVSLKKVTIIKGWFSDTLKEKNPDIAEIHHIAVAWIDCDLYESTVPVLKFLTSRVTTGSVIVFDDWRCFRNQPDFGEQLACREWLQENTHLKLIELFSFGWHGIAFTVISSQKKSERS